MTNETFYLKNNDRRVGLFFDETVTFTLPLGIFFIKMSYQLFKTLS